MTNQIYNAFVEAGLEKEVNKLSETVKTQSGSRIRPAIGHYIALCEEGIANVHGVYDNFSRFLFYKAKDIVENYINKSKNFQGENKGRVIRLLNNLKFKTK